MQISLEKRSKQLAQLLDALEELTRILENDPDSQWFRFFRSCESDARDLLDSFTQEDLNSLSSLITSAYGGMGTFNDYVPPGRESGGRYVVDPEFHDVLNVGGRVYSSALKLRVVGRRRR